MAYRNSIQADALKLVAKKLQSSLAVEGEAFLKVHQELETLVTDDA